MNRLGWIVLWILVSAIVWIVIYDLGKWVLS